jgi:beta-lactam-binding protein with PASTA domain
MSLSGRTVGLSVVALVAGCTLAACSHSPAKEQKNAVRKTTTTSTSTSTTTTTTTTTTAPPAPSTTTTSGVAVPNVIGAKIAAARSALRAVTLVPVSLNAQCNKGTLTSQSVVSSLSIPGKGPNPTVGAVPLNPGTAVAPGTHVGITWSGCFGDSSTVPAVVGLTLPGARQALHAAGLTWACYSVGRPTTTTEASTTPPTGDTTTTVRAPSTVLTQDPAASSAVHPGTTVSLTMYRCPQ